MTCIHLYEGPIDRDAADETRTEETQNAETRTDGTSTEETKKDATKTEETKTDGTQNETKEAMTVLCKPIAQCMELWLRDETAQDWKKQSTYDSYPETELDRMVRYGVMEIILPKIFEASVPIMDFDHGEEVDFLGEALTTNQAGSSCEETASAR